MSYGPRGSFDQNRPNSNRSGLGSNGVSNTGNNGFNPATSSNWVGEKFSLFVGGIAGIQDGWLERILETAGPVLSLRRPSPPFAFVEYSDAESVLRCLEIVNSQKIIMKDGGEKTLLVKADEKTRKRLDDFEGSRTKSEQTIDTTGQAKDDLKAIIALIASGSAPATASTLNIASKKGQRPDTAGPYVSDLAAEDIPSETREVITSEIAVFRERARKLELEKREAEARRTAAQGENYRQQSRQLENKSEGRNNSRFGHPSVDPQSYNKPVQFHAAGTTATVVKQEGRPDGKVPVKSAAPSIDLEQKERLRLERLSQDKKREFEDRESRLEARERTRFGAILKEKNRLLSQAGRADRERTEMRENLAFFDDQEVAREGSELFFTDRKRWRSLRKQNVQRERDADARDAAAEAKQLSLTEKASDAFLNQAMFSHVAQGSSDPTTSLARVNPDEPIVKLSFGSSVVKSVVKPPVQVRPSALGIADEEEEGKVKRELVKLDYSGLDLDQSDEDRKSRRSRRRSRSRSRSVEIKRERSRERGGKARDFEKENERILDLIPSSQVDLYKFIIEWSFLSEAILLKKLSPFVDSCIINSLGAPEPEILNLILDHLRSNKSAEELIQEIEPVLDDEAVELVNKLWKVLIHEILLVKAGF